MDIATLVWLTLLLGTSIPTAALVGHAVLAYKIAPREAVDRWKKYLASEEGGELIATHIGPALEAWIQSDSGSRFIGSGVEEVGKEVLSRVESRLTGAAGNAAKLTDKKLSSALEHLSFGEPLLDGAWALIPKDTKRWVIKRIAQFIRRAGVFNLEITGEDEETGLAVAEMT